MGFLWIKHRAKATTLTWEKWSDFDVSCFGGYCVMLYLYWCMVLNVVNTILLTRFIIKISWPFTQTNIIYLQLVTFRRSLPTYDRYGRLER
ncbi:hypothetical protein HanXRQr2_Chr03g0121031 [Helianthus annuus]|uniref:Uncharacterized protein n=1 Tax=Helianthus annuus TaxID=4232 RepID=A0A9K3NX30_HELAN|nr:hypothetical protein HanXRQr2_Chr03g0121031 [Helianthus annuus]KAJ0593748.1 hypothetical protein HanHA300_Chr03g0101021 [Helianthus annuus]KAJ0608774.1 hypothetical protein HanHA89_Chr03g0112731 [Helianthus annuus]KAJ0774562.1 hypothetical protein HanOQP8_Chr03g0113461 [Helianthus annuus]